MKRWTLEWFTRHGTLCRTVSVSWKVVNAEDREENWLTNIRQWTGHTMENLLPPLDRSRGDPRQPPRLSSCSPNDQHLGVSW